uniref:C-type lectin domain-containing protein n=1 Tax=Magallana gigas TaxID=29159 RepID=A0A8W8J8E0_MAGGI
MLTTWITLTLFLSIGYAANRDVRSKVNCSTLLNKKLFHLHSKLLNVSKTNRVFLKGVLNYKAKNTVPGPKICPNGWKSRKGSCYQVFTDKVNWFQAQMNCRKYDSTLAHIEDELENQWLKKQYSDIKTATWIDVVDLGSEGKWVSFSSGKTANYLPWDGGEPNNYDSSEHCAFIFNGGTEKWFDGNCTSSLVCKKKISV